MRSLAPLLFSLACITAPVTGRKELSLVSDGTMNQLGAQTYAQELAKAKPSSDAAATGMVQRVAKRIAEACHHRSRRDPLPPESPVPRDPPGLSV
jgi:predicted Zn-dependent protease